jgi:hypothetical protein
MRTFLIRRTDFQKEWNTILLQLLFPIRKVSHALSGDNDD